MLICKDSKGTVEVFTCSVHTAVPADGAATFSNTLQGAEDISSWLGNKRPPTALLPATMTLAKEWLYPEAPGYKKIWTRQKEKAKAWKWLKTEIAGKINQLEEYVYKPNHANKEDFPHPSTALMAEKI